ncbi:MAG: CDP-alcohol phosphatidyltransferase family protein [Candidatus Omnitrophota bacterium]
MGRIIESMKELNKIVQKPDYKKRGNWMARNITRDMALPVSWLLLHTSVTANQVTFASLVIGLVGCIAFACGSKNAMLLGAFLLQLWYLLDHVDGHIARYRKQSSLTGLYLDYITHYIIHAGIFIGVGCGVFQQTGNPFYLVAGCIAAFGTVFFNLIYDVKYKSYFARIEIEGKTAVIKPAEKKEGEGQGRGGILRLLFSIIHKLCEVHVLMNIVTLLAILAFFMDFYPWGMVAYVYAFFTMIVAVAKNSYFVLAKIPDKNFEEIFELKDEN